MDKKPVARMLCARICPEVTSVTVHQDSMETLMSAVMSATVPSANANHHINLSGVSVSLLVAMTVGNAPREPSASPSLEGSATVLAQRDTAHSRMVLVPILMSARKDARCVVMEQIAIIRLVDTTVSVPVVTAEIRTMDCALQLNADAVLIRSAERMKSVFNQENASARRRFSSMLPMETNAKVGIENTLFYINEMNL